MALVSINLLLGEKYTLQFKYGYFYSCIQLNTTHSKLITVIPLQSFHKNGFQAESKRCNTKQAFQASSFQSLNAQKHSIYKTGFVKKMPSFGTSITYQKTAFFTNAVAS
jgi:hypothetical protein